MSVTQNHNPSQIIFYGTNWCGQCFGSRKVLQQKGVDFIEIDIDENPDAAEKVLEINGGFRSVPTILFPDGSYLVEPSTSQLQSKLESLDFGNSTW